MTTLNISLPDDLRAVVEDRVSNGAYATHSDYIRDLIRRDQQRVAQERLEAELLERGENAESVIVDAADFRAMREEFLAPAILGAP